MAKLTEAQRDLLNQMRSGATLSHSTLTGNIWSYDGQFSTSVRAQTFNALSLRGLIEPYDKGTSTTGYRLSEAGRLALEGSSHD